MVHLQLKDPYELFVKRREFRLGFYLIAILPELLTLYKCAALWRAVYGPSATERPLRTIREEKGILPQFRGSISSRYDLSC